MCYVVFRFRDNFVSGFKDCLNGSSGEKEGKEVVINAFFLYEMNFKVMLWVGVDLENVFEVNG